MWLCDSVMDRGQNFQDFSRKKKDNNLDYFEENVDRNMDIKGVLSEALGGND